MLAARLKTALLNDRIHVSRSAAGVEDPVVNIVHLKRRPPSPQLAEIAIRAAEDWASDADGARPRAAASLRGPDHAREDAASSLIPGWMADRYPELADAIAADAELLAGMVQRATAAGGTSGGASKRLSARLEAVDAQPCPKWHADTVGARALVTYAGPGTQYLPNSRVRRGWDATGAPVVAGVRFEGGGGGGLAFERAEAWDALLLKGHACPGLLGMGAVHRSPPVFEDEEEEEEEEGEEEEAITAAAARLVLTVDDAAPPCDCCPPAAAAGGDERTKKGRPKAAAAAARAR
jgi:hypothetical protein